MSGANPRRRRRRILFAAILTVSVVAALELGSFLLFWAVEGEMFSYSRQREAVRHLADLHSDDEGKSEPKQPPRLEVEIHPYTGFINTPRANDVVKRRYGHPVNGFGFIDSASPLRKLSADTLVIGVMGGSVAYWFSLLGEHPFMAELQRAPALKGKRVVLVRMAVPGFKQPQQLMALNWVLSLGGQFDVILNIDGFNEATLPVGECRPRGVFPFFPRAWDHLIQQTPDISVLLMAGEMMYLRNQQRDLAQAFAHPIVQYSVTLQFIWSLRNRSQQHDIDENTLALTKLRTAKELPFAVRGPELENLDGDGIYDTIAQQWARSSIQMRSLCHAYGIRYLHFLQPNQYDPDAKPIGSKERAVAIHADPNYPYRIGVEKGYPKLSAKADELRANGVVFHDLRRVFAVVEEQLYVDTCCHFNHRGNTILAKRIAAAVLALY
jgi:hypothetical protein